MLKIGITGGIGSGKSTVSAVFVFLGVPYYNADERAKFLCNSDPLLTQQLIAAFGPEAYENGVYNVAFFRKIAFNHPEVLAQLNALIHPRVADDFQSFCKLHQNAPYILKEAAILFESGSYKALDKTIVVIAPENIRVQRVSNRDGVDKETVFAKMSKQWSDAQRLAMADFVIQNDGSHSLIEQVLTLHRQLMASV